MSGDSENCSSANSGSRFPLPHFYITTQDDLSGPDGDEPYTLFVNQQA
jgi:hypothetical protein